MEDSRANINLMQDLMEKRPSCELCVAKTAEEGLRYAREQHPDLILMDITLPGMNSDEAMLKLKSDDRTIKIPVIAVSANVMEQDVVRGKAIGFVDYLTKPLDMDHFYEVLDRVLDDPAKG